MGLHNKRRKPFRPASAINVSAMSFGSLSSRAVESLNKGVKMAGAYHNTGEGGLSPYHSNGGDVIFHFGTGYFGVRADDGGFSIKWMVQSSSRGGKNKHTFYLLYIQQNEMVLRYINFCSSSGYLKHLRIVFIVIFYWRYTIVRFFNFTGTRTVVL